MIKLKSFVFNPFAENTYVVFDETNECVIIDPGCYTTAEQDELADFISTKELNVISLLNTHGHVDHVLGNKYVVDKWEVKLGMSKQDLPTYNAVPAYSFNLGIDDYTEVEPGFFLEEGDRVEFGNSSLEVIFVPGHSVGHIAFINSDSKIVLAGDVLFNGSIGRTDLPGGNFETLIESIHEKLFVLDDDYIVYSGHGPETTIGKEKATNPFCKLAM